MHLNSLIDLIFLSKLINLISCTIIAPLANSDHNYYGCLLYMFSITSHHNSKEVNLQEGKFGVTIKVISRKPVNFFQTWDNILSEGSSVDENWDKWQTI